MNRYSKELSLEDEINLKIVTFEALAKTNTNYAFEELVRLLKEVAEFRKTHYIEDTDKVIIVVPEKYMNKKFYKPFFDEVEVLNE
jgi:hypothetical protein